eukprot:CAMPEP_0206508656 /NCGR_PEP_ID=MMETSP0324_2-20121206/58470_1 /ASSEMBLY_ACC=CAM_ASM_000836 /TAXON_ID=2866 /ORGANISM="Crypthecodinium cohnii, Strain Seligo" /LENGTH=55 /DNA_ID=CAMNT_0053999577 /DNA_START=467 /DNA_END=631 /DNA_ORIENTATION=-
MAVSVKLNLPVKRPATVPSIELIEGPALGADSMVETSGASTAAAGGSRGQATCRP